MAIPRFKRASALFRAIRLYRRLQSCRSPTSSLRGRPASRFRPVATICCRSLLPQVRMRKGRFRSWRFQTRTMAVIGFRVAIRSSASATRHSARTTPTVTQRPVPRCIDRLSDAFPSTRVRSRAAVGLVVARRFGDTRDLPRRMRRFRLLVAMTVGTFQRGRICRTPDRR